MVNHKESKLITIKSSQSKENQVNQKKFYAASFPIVDCTKDFMFNAKNGYSPMQYITYIVINKYQGMGSSGQKEFAG